jgi:hypothetical protein
MTCALLLPPPRMQTCVEMHVHLPVIWMLNCFALEQVGGSGGCGQGPQVLRAGALGGGPLGCLM